MNTYDVVVVGGDIGAYVSALYLSKQGRKVAFVNMTKNHDFWSLSKALTKDKQRFDFTNPVVEIGGLDENELMYNYLQYLKIDETKINVIKRKDTVLVMEGGRAFSRGNTLKAFLIYLVRHYPKYRHQIHRLKDDLKVLYDDFLLMRDNRLKGRDYTIPKMHIELGQVDLETFLKRYFTHPGILEEFRLVYGFEAYALNEIDALGYFKRFFNIFLEDSYLWVDFKKDVKNVFIDPVHQSVDTFKAKTVSLVKTKNSVTALTLDNGEQIDADYFITEDVNPTLFKQEFHPINKSIIAYYIGLDQLPSELGIKEMDYVFTKVNCCDQMRLFNYSLTSSKPLKGIRVECVNKNEQSNIIETLYKFFPQLKDHVVTVKESQPYYPYSSIPVTKNMTLNHRFKRDHLEHLKLADNAYAIAPFINQESGMIGQFMVGVETAHAVNKHLEEKESETVRLTQDLLITKMLHGFKRKVLDDLYLVKIDMGRRAYTLRMNHSDVYIFNTDDEPDLTITASYDTFYQLHHGTLTVEQALEQKLLESNHKPELFLKVTKALDFGRVHATFTDYSPFKKPLSHLLFSFSIIAFTALMVSVYLTTGFVGSIVFIGFMGVKILVENVKFKRHSFLDFVLLLIGVTVLLNSLFEWALNPNYAFGILALLMGLTVLFKRPFMFIVFYKDEHPRDAWSPLYKTIMQGLSILWVIGFLLSFAITTFTTQPNQLLFIYVMFIMVAVSLRYKSTYIHTTLKGRN